MEAREHGLSSAARIFAFETVEHVVEQRRGPIPLVDFLCGHFIRGFPGDLAFACGYAKRNHDLIAAALPGCGAVAFVCKKVFETSQEKSPKLNSFPTLGFPSQVVFQEM